MTRSAALARVDALVRQRLAAAGATRLAAHLHLDWNPRLRSTAGRAWPRQQAIELNPRLLELDAGWQELERTALHEAAHLLVAARHRFRRTTPHGPEWRRACAELGIPGERATHRLALPRRRLERKHHYACPNCAGLVARVRPLRTPSACAACCRRFAGNRFDRRFLLREVS